MTKKKTPVKKTVTKKTATKKATAKKPVAPVPVAPPVKSEAEKIWDAIKDVRLEMFGLPGQMVHTYYKPLYLDPSKLHMQTLTKATSALAALETALHPKYTVELADRFVIVSLAPTK